MASPTEDLYDEYPVGWVLTYRRRRTPGPPIGSCAIGVVLGPSVRDPSTGSDRIPLGPVDGDAGIPAIWVSEQDIIGLAPGSPPE
ncbi:hypothetical protein [Amycolatopsis sp.]|uniref:hypothetical protein n=1 Tax=Amycolatopsis sp. TaxID=37632 RepID=UPI002D81049E|nr:hypothetical protein [Amycolatopsis sp.]HET6710653.1 hypothetical protein [Amycolatopsis sp.]